MRTVLTALVFACSAELAAQAVLIRPITIEAKDDSSVRLGIALENDLYDALREKGMNVTRELDRTLQHSEFAEQPFVACQTDDCFQKLAKLSGFKRFLVPVLLGTKGKQNLQCNLYSVEDDVVSNTKMLILFIDLPAQKRRAAVAGLMVHLFPEIVLKRIRIRTEPEGAKVSIDGRSVGLTPLEIPSDNKALSVTISLPGFDDISLPVRASDNLDITLTLRHARVGETDSNVASPPTAAQILFRSSVFPGWGQYSRGDKFSGFAFGIGGAALLGSVAYTSLNVRVARDRVIRTYRQGDLVAFVYGQTSGNTTLTGLAASNYILRSDRGYLDQTAHSCGTSSCRAYRQANTMQGLSVIAFGSLYVFNVIDAILSKGQSRTANSGPQLEVTPLFVGANRGAVAAVAVRF